jgi:GNAT superfamily N-acetyltransferase
MSVRLRLLTLDDLGFADSIRAAASWNQTIEDWKRFVGSEPNGCFLAEWNGAPAGTVTTTCYSADLGWIGMLLVHPEYRRHGIGAALLDRAMQHLVGRGVRSVKLDATPLGQPLYERVGFKAECRLTRWEGVSSVRSTGQGSPPLPAGTMLDLPDLAGLDGEAFGISRPDLLLRLFEQSAQTAILRSARFRNPINTPSSLPPLRAFGLLRAGSRAAYLGPVIGKSADEGCRLIRELLAKIPGQPVFWDIFDVNEAASLFAPELGFKPVRPLLRMFYGTEGPPTKRELQYAIADPAVG